MSWTVYALKDPETGEVRYVGKTHNNPLHRLQNHISESLLHRKTHKQRWICSLNARGLVPSMEILDKGTGEGSVEAERRWIACFRESGRLVNSTEGGEGVAGWGTTEERSAVARKREAAMTPEARSARARNRQARLSPEKRSSAVRKWWAGKTPEERKEIGRKIVASRGEEFAKASADNCRKRWASKTPEERKAILAKVRAGIKG